MTYRTLNNYTVNGFVTFMLYCFRILVKLCCESRYTERVSLFFFVFSAATTTRGCTKNLQRALLGDER